jgi:predicted nucleic acid-binding protein
MIVLLDSSVWVSYFHESDDLHLDAVAVVEELKSEETTLLVPDIVLAEVANVLIRIDATDELLGKFQRFIGDHDWLVQVIFGSREFWARTVEHIAHQMRLKTLDLIMFRTRIIFGLMISSHSMHNKKEPRRGS